MTAHVNVLTPSEQRAFAAGLIWPFAFPHTPSCTLNDITLQKVQCTPEEKCLPDALAHCCIFSRRQTERYTALVPRKLLTAAPAHEIALPETAHLSFAITYSISTYSSNSISRPIRSVTPMSLVSLRYSKILPAVVQCYSSGLWMKHAQTASMLSCQMLLHHMRLPTTSVASFPGAHPPREA